MIVNYDILRFETRIRVELLSVDDFVFVKFLERHQDLGSVKLSPVLAIKYCY